MNVMQAHAIITIHPSRIMNWAWLFANLPPNPSLSSTDRNIVRTNKVVVASKSAVKDVGVPENKNLSSWGPYLV